MSMMQGPHEVDQKSSRITFFPSWLFMSNGWPSKSTVLNGGAGLPSSGWGGSGSMSSSTSFAPAGGLNAKSAALNLGATVQSENATVYGTVAFSSANCFDKFTKNFSTTSRVPSSIQKY